MDVGAGLAQVSDGIDQRQLVFLGGEPADATDDKRTLTDSVLSSLFGTVGACWRKFVQVDAVVNHIRARTHWTLRGQPGITLQLTAIHSPIQVLQHVAIETALPTRTTAHLGGVHQADGSRPMPGPTSRRHHVQRWIKIDRDHIARPLLIDELFERRIRFQRKPALPRQVPGRHIGLNVLQQCRGIVEIGDADVDAPGS